MIKIKIKNKKMEQIGQSLWSVEDLQRKQKQAATQGNIQPTSNQSIQGDQGKSDHQTSSQASKSILNQQPTSQPNSQPSSQPNSQPTSKVGTPVNKIPSIKINLGPRNPKS